jgi:hypothetical protein
VEAAIKEYDNLTYTTSTQERAVDKSTVRDWLANYLKKNGSSISANDGIGDYLHGNIAMALEAKGLEIRRDGAANTWFKNKRGVSIEEAIDAENQRLVQQKTRPTLV